MFRKILLVIGLILTINCLHAWPMQIDTLSTEAKVSLMTCGPGKALYASFGHSAIRIQDPAQNYDYVFNYGTFDFNTPNFALQFIRGKLLYYLTIEPYQSFEMDYIEDERWIIEQELNLTRDEAEDLLSLLLINAKPENRAYHYDFLRDNCSSRIRDMLKTLLGDRLTFRGHKWRKLTTYRKMIDSNMLHNEWTDLGMDLLIGAPTDRRAGSWEQMFLPDYLMKAFDEAVIIDDTAARLAKPPVVIQDFPTLNTERHPLTSPQVIFWAAFILYLIWLIRRPDSHNISPIFPFITHVILGLIGWVLLFMWFGTDHSTTKWNFNLLWANPLNLPMAFYFFSKNMPDWVRRYFNLYRIALTVLIFIIPILPQQYHQAVIPLILLQVLQLSAMLPLPKLDNPAEI
jgi:hypothetical protein